MVLELNFFTRIYLIFSIIVKWDCWRDPTISQIIPTHSILILVKDKCLVLWNALNNPLLRFSGHIQHPLQQMATLFLSLAFCLHCFIFTAMKNSQPLLAIWTSILPTSILYFGARSTLLLATFAWSISITCPSHVQFSLMSVAVTAVLYNFVSYWVVLIFHTICSVVVSHTFLKFFLHSTKPEFYFFVTEDHVVRRCIKTSVSIH